GVQPRAYKRELAEKRTDNDRVVAFTRAPRAAVGAGLLLRHKGRHLLLHERVLQLSQHRFGLRQCQAEGFGRKCFTLQAGNLVHDGRLVVTFNHQLYRHFHTDTSALTPGAAVVLASCRSWRLSARRSNRSTANQYRSVSSSACGSSTSSSFWSTATSRSATWTIEKCWRKARNACGPPHSSTGAARAPAVQTG